MGDHITYICKKASQRLYFITLLQRAGVPPADLISVYCTILRSTLEYAAVVWHPGLTKEQRQQIEHIQKRAMQIIYNDHDCESALHAAQLEHLSTRTQGERICVTSSLHKSNPVIIL